MKSTLNSPELVNLEPVKKLYPNYRDIKIASVYRPGSGWAECLPQPICHNALQFLNDTGATHVNLSLVDEFGETRRPDYSVKELINY